MERENQRAYGRYTAVRGKLSKDDARVAYVTMPVGINGRIAPIASFWSFDEAVRWAREHHERDEGGA